MYNFNFIWNMECMVLNQTLEVRRKEKQNNLGEQKKVKLYVNYFSPCSTFISLHSPSNSHFFKVCDEIITTMLHKSPQH